MAIFFYFVQQIHLITVDSHKVDSDSHFPLIRLNDIYNPFCLLIRIVIVKILK